MNLLSDIYKLLMRTITKNSHNRRKTTEGNKSLVLVFFKEKAFQYHKPKSDYVTAVLELIFQQIN